MASLCSGSSSSQKFTGQIKSPVSEIESQVESTVDSSVVQDCAPNQEYCKSRKFPNLPKRCIIILYIVFYKTNIQTFVVFQVYKYHYFLVLKSIILIYF